MTSTPTFPQAISLSDFPADVLNIAAGAVGEMPDRPPFKADVLLAIARAIMADRQRDQWMPIETAPVGQQILGWEPLYGCLLIVIDNHDDKIRLKSSGNFWEVCPKAVKFTHWAPLQPPKQEA